MGNALKYLRELLEKIGLELDRKTAASLLILLLLLILLPIGLFLIKGRLTFLPKAAGELIQLGEGGCIKLDKDKKKVVDCSLVPLKLVNPFFAVSADSTSSPSSSSSPTTNPYPPVHISANPNPCIITSGETCTSVITWSFPAASDIKIRIKENPGSLFASGATGSQTAPWIRAAGATFQVYINDVLSEELFVKGVSQTGSSVPSASAAASPAASTASPRNVSVGSFNNNIQAALDSVKDSGGTVYMPAGTYMITQKVRVYSNTTLFGDGMGATIIKFGDNVPVDDMMANDSTSGQQDIVIRDLTLQGPDIPRITDCCHGLKLENLTNAYVINVEVNDVGMDGIYLGYKLKSKIPQGVTNVRVSGCRVNRAQRQQIGLIVGTNVVIDGCVIDGTNKYGQQVYVGIDLEPDDASATVNNSYIIGNTVSNTNIGIALNGTGGESKTAAAVHDNKVCANSVNAKSIPIADTGQNNQITDSICQIPGALANLPPAPSKPTAKRESFLASLIGSAIRTVFAQDTGDDNFTGTSGDDSNDVFTASPNASNNSSTPGNTVLRYRLAETQVGLNQAPWKEFVLKPGNPRSLFAWFVNLFKTSPSEVYAQDTGDDNFTGTSGDDSNDVFTASTSASGAPASSGNPTFKIGKQFINVNFQLKDIKPGTKQIWVQYLHPDGSTRVDNVTFALVDKTPQILGLACNLDIAKENLKITIDGDHFGTAIGTASIVTPNTSLEVLGWNNKQVVGLLKKPNIPIDEGQRFIVKVTRPDGFESGTAVCAVNKSLVSLRARIFCREPGKFDASDVVVTLLSSSDEAGNNSKLSKVEEKVTISADGEIQNLKTQFQVGKNYAIAIKAPNSLRRSALFTAMEGTTEIVRPDGSPFILPIGDIAPKVSVDGQINSLDRSELIRQWRILGQGETKQTGDFNRDGRVNSIDWACMQYDFGSSDDPIPTEVPGSASSTLHIQTPASGTLFIPVSSPTPKPSSVSLLLQKAEFLLIS